MKRYYGSQQNVSKPVEKITLDAKTASKWRIFFIALFFCIGIGSLIYAFTHLGNNQKGWQKVVLKEITVANSSYDFTFLYEFGAGGKRVSKEMKKVKGLYEKLCISSYRIFDRLEEYDGIRNLCYLNRHPNETVEIDPSLYAAFETFEREGGRMLYLGALTVHLEVLITSDSDEALAETDPYTNGEVMAFFQKTAAYAADEQSVNLELLGNNRVILHVSDEYLAFAKANDIVDFVDFGWTRNAVICDYIANGLAAEGYRHGILTSYDGFTRNFAGSDESYAYDLILANDGTADKRGTLTYQEAKSFVWLHDYVAAAYDRLGRVLTLADGKKRHTYLGAEGLPQSALNDLVVWSPDGSCTKNALIASRYYIADTWDATAAEQDLKSRNIEMLTYIDGVVRCTDASVTIETNK